MSHALKVRVRTNGRFGTAWYVTRSVLVLLTLFVSCVAVQRESRFGSLYDSEGQSADVRSGLPHFNDETAARRLTCPMR